MPQIWAEAVHRHKAGESIVMPEYLWAVAKVEQDARMIGDPWEDILHEYLGHLDGKIQSADVWKLLETKVGSATERQYERLSDILTKLGWEYSRRRFKVVKGVNGSTPQRCYIKGKGPYKQVTVECREGEIKVYHLKGGEFEIEEDEPGKDVQESVRN
jgi:predicted P-loop ATPase